MDSSKRIRIRPNPGNRAGAGQPSANTNYAAARCYPSPPNSTGASEMPSMLNRTSVTARPTPAVGPPGHFWHQIPGGLGMWVPGFSSSTPPPSDKSSTQASSSSSAGPSTSTSQIPRLTSKTQRKPAVRSWIPRLNVKKFHGPYTPSDTERAQLTRLFKKAAKCLENCTQSIDTTDNTRNIFDECPEEICAAEDPDQAHEHCPFPGCPMTYQRHSDTEEHYIKFHVLKFPERNIISEDEIMASYYDTGMYDGPLGEGSHFLGPERFCEEPESYHVGPDRKLERQEMEDAGIEVQDTPEEARNKWIKTYAEELHLVYRHIESMNFYTQFLSQEMDFFKEPDSTLPTFIDAQFLGIHEWLDNLKEEIEAKAKMYNMSKEVSKLVITLHDRATQDDNERMECENERFVIRLEEVYQYALTKFGPRGRWRDEFNEGLGRDFEIMMANPPKGVKRNRS